MSSEYDRKREDVMAEFDYAALQQRYGGRYVARRGSEIVASGESYDDLSEQLDDAAVEWHDIIVEYVEPSDLVRIY